MFCLTVFASCGITDESVFEFDLSTVYNQVNFEKPAVGQVSSYIHFRGFNFSENNSSIDYTGDTLEVTLISKSGSNYTFQERIKEGSSVFSASDPYIDGHDILKISEWEVLHDTLKFIGGNTFLYWNTEGSIPLVVDAETPKVTLKKWGNNTPDFGSYFGVITGRINDFNYDELTVSYLIVNPGMLHADVFELMVNRPFGIVRSSIFNSDLLNGTGWDLQLGN